MVDDDQATCINVINILTKKGCKVGIAHTGELAIVMVQKSAYDIISIDMKLSNINGLETY